MTGIDDAELIRQSVLAVGHGLDPEPGATRALLRSLDVRVADDAAERRITDDQTNASVVVGDKVIVKWLRSPDPVDRGSLLVQHLTAVGFADTPELLGRLRDSDGTSAVVHRYLPGARDGWTWCVDAAGTELDAGTSTGWAAETGRLAGRLTLALATPSDVLPAPVSVDVDQLVLAAECAAEVAAATRFEGGPDLATAWAMLDSAPYDVDERIAGLLLHGDLHVGQFLRWPGGLAVVDFDGDPQRGDEPEARDAPDVDLAHLLVSVELVGSVVAKRRESEAGIAAWVAASRQELLDAYLAELTAAGRLDLHRPGLLALLEVRQLARELEYAAAYLPRFAYATEAALDRRIRG